MKLKSLRRIFRPSHDTIEIRYQYNINLTKVTELKFEIETKMLGYIHTCELISRKK